MCNLTKYPKTAMLKIIDTISVPHPFMITTKHIVYASDHWNSILGDNAIEDYEKKHRNRPSCGVKNCNLLYHEHKTALLVEVKSKKELQDIPELREFLLKCNPICEADGYAGFTFIQK